MLFEYGEFVTLDTGKTMIIGRSNTDNIISLEKVNELYKEGKVKQKTIEIDGDDVFVDI